MVHFRQVVVDGLRRADEADAGADALTVIRQLPDGIHGIVAADIDERLDLVLVQQFEDLFKYRGSLFRIRQFKAAGAQESGRGLPQQLDQFIAAQHRVQIHQGFLQKALDAVAHAVHFVRAHGLGPAVDACQRAVDDRRRSAGLPHDYVLHMKSSFHYKN